MPRDHSQAGDDAIAAAAAAFIAKPRGWRVALLVGWTVLLTAGYLRFELERVTEARLTVLGLVICAGIAFFRRYRNATRLLFRLPDAQKRESFKIVRETERAERAELRALGRARFFLQGLRRSIIPFMTLYAIIVAFVPKFTFGTLSPMFSAMIVALAAGLGFATWGNVKTWRKA